MSTMNITYLETVGDTNFVLYRVKFAILLVLQIAAILLTIIIVIFFIKHPIHLKPPQNHGLLLLLVVNSIQLIFDIPLSLNFYIYGYVNPPTATLCIWWTYFEYIMYAVPEYLLATISLQRHMFIFHQNILRNRWIRNLLHHLPLTLCIIYPPIFYLFAIVLYPCDNTQWDFTSRVCGFANCYLVYGTVLGIFDLVVNNSMPVVIDILANITMIARVIMQKRRARQAVRWGQQRRMMMQLLCLSSLYLTGWAPFLLVEIINVVSNPNFLHTVEENYFGDLIYICYLFLPWLWLGFFPELVKWIMQWCRRRRAGNAVGIMQSRNAVGTIQTNNATRSVQPPNATRIGQSRVVVRTVLAPHVETIA
jgi:hypothetical protein